MVLNRFDEDPHIPSHRLPPPATSTISLYRPSSNPQPDSSDTGSISLSTDTGDTTTGTSLIQATTGDSPTSSSLLTTINPSSPASAGTAQTGASAPAPSLPSSLTQTSGFTLRPSSSPAFSVSPSTAADASTSARRANAGAIAGGVVGGLLGLLLLLGLLFWFLRTRRRRKIAPSSEFMARPGGGSTSFSFTNRPSVLDDPDPPPPFLRGTFTDPIAEKVREAEGHRSLWRGPNSDTESGHGRWHYGPRQDAEDPEGIPVTSPSTERSARSERSFLIL
ncbi:uncharacterized protein C8Q71DRAFT_461849 [Rhodofomes roseus]|uniref:Uncharacterized protein n=1 Tax=Rhodofomes roseus TaxID=34475 RepID=A0ABQ8KN58_9APHY|nr:uncharacterized protein C8Q71DRAFT_461849 [Rhodofomes roseus]KAH9839756.1 hypothetical protein C8Q71DRAFT_461849 [Rhodofomes roseus]